MLHKLKLLWFAVNQMSQMGLWFAGAAFTGGETKTRRAAAYSRLYMDAMDAVIDKPQPPMDQR